jgi:hypothetical protein
MLMSNGMITENNELEIVGKNTVVNFIAWKFLGGTNKNCKASQLMFMVRFTG